MQQVEEGKALQLLALCPFCWHQRQSTFGGGEFCDGDGVNIHCIGVFLEVGNEG